MQPDRGILYLQDPLNHADHNLIGTNEQRLVFTENEPLLYQAQGALQNLRRKHGWVCVCARGNAAYIALALAAQLPLDRLALIGVPQHPSPMNRQMNRLCSFARRNLALITAQILLWDADEALVHALVRGSMHSRLCMPDQFSAQMLTMPWEALMENNLLIRGKCV